MLKQTHPQSTHRKLEIAQRIRQARRRQGWTQEQTADLLGCSRKRYNSMEQGRTELGVTEIDLLAEVFNVPVEFFFERPGNQKAAASQN